MLTRWCNGPCGRELPIEAFPRNGEGYREHRCVTCKRFRMRQRYRSYASLRRYLARYHRDWYARNAERERAKQRLRDQAKKLRVA